MLALQFGHFVFSSFDHARDGSSGVQGPALPNPAGVLVWLVPGCMVGQVNRKRVAFGIHLRQWYRDVRKTIEIVDGNLPVFTQLGRVRAEQLGLALTERIISKRHADI